MKTDMARQTRREFLKHSLYGGLAAGMSGLGLSGCRQKQTKSEHTNVILISIDTLRADHLGCYGYARPTSPTLDKFASQGLLFEDVSTTSPWTLPAHASLLTGLYPSHNGVQTRRHRLPREIITLANVLRENGFLTTAVVNSHWLSKNYRLNQGFDDFTYVVEDAEEVAPSKVGDKASKWLSKHSSKPFFLFLHYLDVHSDYRSLPRYEKQFVRPYSGIIDGSTAQIVTFRDGLLSLNQADVSHLIDLYDAGIRQMDDSIARLFKLLKKKNLFDNTFIIVTADHGDEFLEHGGVLHGRTQFQELIHVPLIIRGPGLPQSKRIKHIASLVDVMPTTLSLLGIDPPAGLDGIDLRTLWRNGDSEPPPRLLFAEADRNNLIGDKITDDIRRAVRHPRYKLHYDLWKKKTQLYDILGDPQEKVNVADKHGPMADSLLRALKDYMRIKKTGESAPALFPEEIERLKSLGYLR